MSVYYCDFAQAKAALIIITHTFEYVAGQNALQTSFANH